MSTPAASIRPASSRACGSIWCGSSGDGVFRYDGATFQPFTTADGLADDNVMTARADDHGYVWFGTYGRGVSRYGADGFVTFYVTETGAVKSSTFKFTVMIQAKDYHNGSKLNTTKLNDVLLVARRWHSQRRHALRIRDVPQHRMCLTMALF